MAEEINLHRLTYLYEAVLAGSVRAAADKLNINASVISRQIALLEADLSSTVVERSNRGVKLTEIGEMLVEYYRAHRAMNDDLLEKLRETRGLQRGHIAIALGAGFVSDLMGPPLQAFCTRYPGLTFDIEAAGTNEVVRRICEDTAHVGLVYNPSPESIVLSRATAVQPLCAIVRHDHPLKRLGRPLMLKEILKYQVAMKPISFGTMQLLELAAKVDHIPMQVSLTTNSSSVMYHYLRHHEAVTFAPAFSIAQELVKEELAALPIDHAVLRGAQAHLIIRLGRSLPVAVQRLVTHLATTMDAFKAAK